MKDDKVYLLHIRDAIRRIRDYTTEGKEAFLEDQETQDAVVRNLEIIGEAVKKLSATARQKGPEIPSKRIAGMRDKMIHEYFGVDLALVWDVVERDLGSLESRVGRLLSCPKGG